MYRVISIAAPHGARPRLNIFLNTRHRGLIGERKGSAAASDLHGLEER
jgi:hypothetical protein